MGWRFRRTVRVLPGVRVNLTKTGMGVTLGPRGMHYSIHSSGRQTVSAGLPGTGLYWQDSWFGEHPSRRSPTTTRAAAPPQPTASAQFVEAAPVHQKFTEPAREPTPEPTQAAAATVHDLADFIELLRTTASKGGKLEAALAALDDALGSPEQTATIATAAQRCVTALRDSLTVGLSAHEFAIPIAPGLACSAPIDSDTALIFAGCIVSSHGCFDVALVVVRAATTGAGRLVAESAILLAADRAVDVLALGEAAVIDELTWVAALLRARALRLCHRADEAREELDELLDDQGLDIDAALWHRAQLELALCLIAANKPADALPVLVDVLVGDPLNTEAAHLLATAQTTLTASTSTEVQRVDPALELHKLQLVYGSLEAELQAGQEDLEQVIAELEFFRQEHDERLGSLARAVADAKARLARLIAQRSSDPDDQLVADAAEHTAEQVRTGAAGDGTGPSSWGDTDLPDDGPDSPSDDPELANELKRLYRLLALRWHPDRTQDPDEKARRTRVFQRILDLYRAKDVDGLRALWDLGEFAADDDPSGDDRARLLTAIEAVRARLDEIHAQLRGLLDSSLAQLRQQCLDGATEDRDVLAEVAAQLEIELEQLTDACTALDNEPGSQP